MSSASPRSHRPRLQPSRHDIRRLQPARSYPDRASSCRPRPHQAFSAQRVSIALAAAATSRPPVPPERCAAKTAAVGRRRAVAPVLVRACLTGNRTRRFPGAMRPARRDRQDIRDRSPIERWRRNHAETHLDAGAGAGARAEMSRLRVHVPASIRFCDGCRQVLWDVGSFRSHSRLHAG
jgi:RNase P subunit RPR2